MIVVTHNNIFIITMMCLLLGLGIVAHGLRVIIFHLIVWWLELNAHYFLGGEESGLLLFILSHMPLTLMNGTNLAPGSLPGKTQTATKVKSGDCSRNLKISQTFRKDVLGNVY